MTRETYVEVLKAVRGQLKLAADTRDKSRPPLTDNGSERTTP